MKILIKDFIDIPISGSTWSGILHFVRCNYRFDRVSEECCKERSEDRKEKEETTTLIIPPSYRRHTHFVSYSSFVLMQQCLSQDSLRYQW